MTTTKPTTRTTTATTTALVMARKAEQSALVPQRVIRFVWPRRVLIDVRAIISQAALALYSQEEQEATACPPHDLYVDSCARGLEILLLTRLFLLLLGIALVTVE